MELVLHHTLPQRNGHVFAASTTTAAPVITVLFQDKKRWAQTKLLNLENYAAYIPPNHANSKNNWLAVLTLSSSVRSRLKNM